MNCIQLHPLYGNWLCRDAAAAKNELHPASPSLHPSIWRPRSIVLNFGFREWVLLLKPQTLLLHSSGLSSVKAPPLSSQSFHSGLHVVLVLSGGTHVDMGLSLISNDCNLTRLIAADIHHHRCGLSVTDFKWLQFALFDSGRYFSSSINVCCYSG